MSDLAPPTTYTLAAAVAELQRIGPVYSAATRLVDEILSNMGPRLTALEAVVKVARPTAGPTHGDLPSGSNRDLDQRTAADWSAISGV